MEQLTIRAFRAVDEPALCQEYVAEHAKVLQDFGVDHVVAPDLGWTKDPTCMVVVAIHATLGMVGGIKIFVDQKGGRLPMEGAIHAMDHRVATVLDALVADGNAEVCGLWNANRYAGRGLPLLLSLAAVSMGNQMGLKSMTCLVAHYTLRHALKAGFIIMEEVGDGGTFTYPIPDIKSVAMVIPDVLTLGTARPEFREKILSLRLRPLQTRLEPTAGAELLVTYDLLVERKVIELRAYRSIQQQRTQFLASA